MSPERPSPDEPIRIELTHDECMQVCSALSFAARCEEFDFEDKLEWTAVLSERFFLAVSMKDGYYHAMSGEDQ